MKIVPLNPSQHGKLKVKNETDFSVATTSHFAPIVMQEFASAAVDFPIIFLKNPDNASLQAVVMLGLKPGENLMTDGKTWDGLYVPALFKHLPFRLQLNQDQPDQVMVLVDEDSPLLGDEGEAILDDKGEATEAFQKRQEAMLEYMQAQQMTMQGIAQLQELDLFKVQKLTFEVAGQTEEIEGIYLIDEEKLKQLDTDKFIEMRDNGLLGIIYAHLNSQPQIHRLLARRADKSA